MDTELLQAALAGLEYTRDKLDQKMVELHKMLRDGAGGNHSTTAAPARPRRKISAAARKRIGTAQKKRWAAFRKSRAAQNKTIKTGSQVRGKAPIAKRVGVKSRRPGK